MVIPAHPLTRRLAVLACLVAVLGGVLFGYQTASAKTVGVDGGNNWFCSEDFEDGVCTTTVIAGDTVTWTMVAGTHTVTECDPSFTECPPTGGFASDILLTGDTFSQVFPSEGVFPYRCELHPSDMRGSITVLEPTPTAAPTASPTPVPSGQTAGPTAVPTITAAGLPQTGGAPTEGVNATLLLAIAAMLITCSSLAVFCAKRPRE